MAKSQIGVINKAIVNAKATIYKDYDYGEYVVKFRRNGEYLKDSDYFTDDKDDAFNTAHCVLNQMAEKETD